MVDGRQTLEASDQEKVERVFRVELAKAIHFLERDDLGRLDASDLRGVLDDLVTINGKLDDAVSAVSDESLRAQYTKDLEARIAVFISHWTRQLNKLSQRSDRRLVRIKALTAKRVLIAAGLALAAGGAYLAGPKPRDDAPKQTDKVTHIGDGAMEVIGGPHRRNDIDYVEIRGPNKIILQVKVQNEARTINKGKTNEGTLFVGLDGKKYIIYKNSEDGLAVPYNR